MEGLQRKFTGVGCITQKGLDLLYESTTGTWQIPPVSLSPVSSPVWQGLCLTSLGFLVFAWYPTFSPSLWVMLKSGEDSAGDPSSPDQSSRACLLRGECVSLEPLIPLRTSLVTQPQSFTWNEATYSCFIFTSELFLLEHFWIYRKAAKTVQGVSVYLLLGFPFC